MEPEKREAMRRAARPYRRLVRRVSCLVPLVASTLFVTGHWCPGLTLLALVLIAMMLFGAWLSRQGPPDSLQRLTYESSLRVMEETRNSVVPVRGCLHVLFWPLNLVAALGGRRDYLRMAQAGDRGTAWLLQRLDAPEPFDRWRAAKALGAQASESAVEALAKRLEDADARVREAAAQALGRIGGTESLSALEHCAKETSDDVLWLQALAALYNHGRRPEVPPWRLQRAINLIKAEDELDADRLGGLLGSLPIEVAGEALRDLLPSLGAGRIKALERVAAQETSAGRAFVREQLASESSDILRATLLTLLRHPDPEAEESVRSLKDHADPELRRLAEWALERSSSERIPR